jgi:hypothetical protein
MPIARVPGPNGPLLIRATRPSATDQARTVTSTLTNSSDDSEPV